ncbi:hypothetical protein WJX75_004871 [Coccomyxa subellipsoidea]|uniref:Signal peptidase complex subunit 3 n=1 Tax=Coccomyxa subellipsoidea TaxID=248742 RepID=A0ABR2YJJ2_9CHLO
MHTYMYRMNALFTVASTALAVICAAAALTDWTFTSDPPVSLQVKSYDGLQRESGEHRAWMTMQLKADLRDVFHWNTKQAFMYITAEFETPKNEVNQAVVWSRIVQKQKDANIKETVRFGYPYQLTDPGLSLHNTTFSLMFNWETVPVVGAMHRDTRVFPGLTFPGEYFRTRAIPKGW